MVSTRALKLGGLVVAGLVVLFVAGFVVSIVSRLLSLAVLMLLVAGVGYVAYRLYSWWAASDAGSGASTSGVANDARAPVGEPREQSTSGELSEEEFEAHLEEAMDADGGSATSTRDREPSVEDET